MFGCDDFLNYDNFNTQVFIKMFVLGLEKKIERAF